MKTPASFYLSGLVAVALLLSVAPARAQGTAFTYQGRLDTVDGPASGNYEMVFYLCNTPASGGQLANLGFANVPISNGFFAVTLEFGSLFDGSARWLEIAVKTNSAPTFTTVSPRQPLTPTPYAITAGNLTGALPASQLTGPLPSANLSGTYSDIVTFSNAANSFAGNGAGLTGLNATQITAGTLDDARLPGVITSDITGTAAMATNVTGNASNTGSLFTTRNPAVFSGTAVLSDGGLALGSGVFGAHAWPDVNWRMGIEFMPLGWNGIRPTAGNSGEPSWAAIRCYTNWGNSPSQNNPTLHVLSRGAIRLENGFATAGFGRIDNYLNLGNEDANGRIMVTYVSRSYFENGLQASNKLGFSQPLIFHAISKVNAGTRQSYPAIQGFGMGVDPDSTSPLGPMYLGELEFQTRMPAQNTTNASYGDQLPNVKRVGGRMLTNGWRLFGRQIREQAVPVFQDTNIVLNFAGPYAQTINLTSTATNRFVTTNVNTFGGATNYEAKVFRIVAGASDRPLEWPEAWVVVSESGNATLPPLLPASKVLHLQLEAWGDGNSNIIARCQTGPPAPAALLRASAPATVRGLHSSLGQQEAGARQNVNERKTFPEAMDNTLGGGAQ